MTLESLHSDYCAAYFKDGEAVGLTLGFVDDFATVGGLVGRNSSAGGRADVGLTVLPIVGFDVSTTKGFGDGLDVGFELGFDDGTADGADDGSGDGAGVGAFDGCDDG